MNYQKILPIFSYIFHPIFVSFYGLLLYFWWSDSDFNSVTFVLFIQVVILTILLPLSIYFLLKAIGLIHSFTEATIQERRLPIFLQILFLGLLLKFSSFLDTIPLLYFFFLGGIIAGALALIFSLLKFKVSLHMMGVCSLFIFAISISIMLNSNTIPLIAFLIVIIGNVASSRLYMKSHTVDELIAGSAIGMISQAILWQFYL